MTINLLNSKFQKATRDDFHSYYLEELNQYREDIQDDYENSHLTKEFQEFFKPAISSKQLDHFSNINWSWLKLVENIVQVIYLHEELEINDDLELSESEDELFNFWHDSDYANIFLESVNESKDLLLESQKLFKLLQEQVMAFFILHIDSSIPVSEITYCAQTELGESEDRIFLKSSYYDVTNDSLFFKITNEKELLVNGLKFEDQIVNTIDGELEIRTFKQEHDTDIISHISRINKAMNLINEISTSLGETFLNFTDVIVPINEKGLVSYSMQNLPGHSCINLYDRDDIDLLDDLLHENGHHYMNAFLNVEDLIIEDDEKIYYSPWRRALRPIRGIYHAYFTFYWAYLLFKETINSAKFNSFSSEEQNKILKRYCEEYIMLNYCWPDLMHARREEKITDRGLEVINLINTDISSTQSNTNFLETLLQLERSHPESYVSLKDLIELLEKIKKHYS